MSLTPKQQRFVEEYVCIGGRGYFNATQAAILAGYSARTAASIGEENLRKPEIKAAIEVAKNAQSERLEIKADDTLRELQIVGRSSVWDYVIDDRGHVALAPGVRPEAIRAVSSIKRKVRHLGEGRMEYETEIKLWPKVQAQELLGKHKGLFPTRHEHGGKDGQPIQVSLTMEDAQEAERRYEEWQRRRGTTDQPANGNGRPA